MTASELIQVMSNATQTIAALWSDNVKLRHILKQINDRDDVTDDVRHFILEETTSKKGLH